MEQVKIISELLPLVGRMTVLGCAAVMIYYLLTALKQLKEEHKIEIDRLLKALKEKDEQLAESMDAHLEDLKSGNKDYKDQVESFSAFVSVMNTMLLKKK